MLKAIIIYHTLSGNTKSLAEKIKKQLESLNIEVEIYQDINFQENSSLKDYDIIGLGTPTHYFQIAKEFKAFLLKIKDFNLRGKRLIVFGTGTAKSSPPKICNDIIKIMKPSGIQTIAKIGCVKTPTDETDSKIEKIISKDIFSK
ncbi:MAG: flavodoxin family protein [Promethearchaeota archaeon]